MTMGLSMAWIVGVMVANGFVCKPVYKFWKPLVPGDCANYSLYFVLTGILETIIDVIILILPIQMVLSINLPTRSKIILASIFMLGILYVPLPLLSLILTLPSAQSEPTSPASTK